MHWGRPYSSLGSSLQPGGHFEEMIALYDPQQHSSYASLYVQTLGVSRIFCGLDPVGIWAIRNQAPKETPRGSDLGPRAVPPLQSGARLMGWRLTSISTAGRSKPPRSGQRQDYAL